MVLDKLTDFFVDEKASSEWSTLYLIVVFAIAAILIIAVVKPMFKSAQRQQLLTPVAPTDTASS